MTEYLRNIVVGLGRKVDGTVREDHFVITVASEIMAILCLADDISRFKRKTWKNNCCLYIMMVEPVTAKDITGSRFNGSTFKGCY